MAHKFFYAWQSERPSSVCRSFIKDVLESISSALKQEGIDERIEIDSDTQGVPGTPEILSTIIRKIEEDDVFIADLTMCSESQREGETRRSPNPNVMFEYGYALKAKTRDRIICVMNTFYGGNDPSELPFDLRHARAPFRYSLAPGATADEKKKVSLKLRNDLLPAAKLIVENIPSPIIQIPKVDFQRPHFSAGEMLTPEGDIQGQNNPTYFDESAGFVYLRGRPLKPLELTVAKIRSMEISTSALTIASGSSSGSFGTNKFGRVIYAIKSSKPRISADYVQYFRTGEIEIMNGSYLPILTRNGGSAINADYLVGQIVAPMLNIAQNWLQKLGDMEFVVEVGIIGVEGWRLALTNFGTGPMIHVPRISIQKKVDKDSIPLLAQELRSALLAEVGIA
jgi:Predicted nucleotide-binding protein containing TIR-like domain